MKTDSLMAASSTQYVVRICTQFGTFVKMSVEIVNMNPDPEPVQLRNAFTVLMDSQRQLQHGNNGLPFSRTVRDGRDRMYNDLITFLRELGVKWSDPEVNGVPLLKCLTKTLWYIDGHHNTIAEKLLVHEFGRFNGYILSYSTQASKVPSFKSEQIRIEGECFSTTRSASK